MPVYIAEPREQNGRRQLAVAGGFVLLALILNVLPPGGQTWVSGIVRATVLAPFLWTQERLMQARVVATQATDLQAQLDSLTQEMVDLGALAEENRRLRALLGLDPRGRNNVVAASVVRPGTSGSENLFWLDKGRTHGIQQGDAVLVAEGLLGLVLQAEEGGAIGMDWTHPDFRVSAMTLDGLVYGFVESVPGFLREDDRLLFNGAPYSSDIPAGTEIVASGRGGFYPRGIRVGVVDTVAEADAGWRKSYWIQPAVIPASVTHALVRIRGDGPTVGTIDDLDLQFDSALFELTLPALDTTIPPDSGSPPPTR